ncbi:ArnT family glycosyltransferase [Saccharomonospora saliphila]|uniref:ArnT family glycosyltransferase n=1 Tax=Saccharomonospora saliphila TaxID=369829 RepID=UPI0003703D52|nr:glycosyltransferase family 39 protein [Saccharomonospora saliphila]
MAVPQFARLPVLVVAGVAMAVLLAFSGRYGYHGDELYFLAAGRHLDWGYADQPPLLPLLARLMDTLFPGSVVGLRLPAVVFTGLGIVIAALTAREFGGERRAQVMAAGAYACSPFLLAGAGHILATHMVDVFLWTVIAWLVVRWVRLRDDRLLFAAGLVTAVDLQVKFLIPVFWVVLVLAALAVGPRDLPRRPLLWAGGAVAVLTCVPTLVWQATHGWPQLEMNRIVADEVSYAGGRLTFLPMALEQAGIGVGAVLVVLGVWWLSRRDELRPYRFLGLTVLGVTAVFWATAGRPYYVGGLFALCFAVAAVRLDTVLTERWRPARWKPVVAVAYAVSALVAISWLPIKPISAYAGEPYSPMNMELEEFGWPQVADSVARAYHELPDGLRADVTIVTETYWQASAVEHFRPDLPRPYSGGRGFYYFGVPPSSSRATLFVGASRDELAPHFGAIRRVGVIDNGREVNNGNQGEPIWLCVERSRPWDELWPEFRHMTFTW